MKWKKDEARAVFVLEPDEYSELLQALEKFDIFWEDHQLSERDAELYEAGIVVPMDVEYLDKDLYFLCKKREEKEEE